MLYLLHLLEFYSILLLGWQVGLLRTKGNYSVESDEIYSLGRGEHKAKACCQILQEKKKNIFNCKVTYSTIDKFEDPIDLKEDGYTDKYHNLGGDPFTFAIKAEETINIQIKNNNGENK